MTSAVEADRHSVHFAVYKWKEGSPVDEIERGFDEICRMGGQVAGVRVVSWGRNSSPHACGYTHAMTIVGDNMDAVREYRELARGHPMSAVMSTWEETGVGADYDYRADDRD
jgi:hypothetical protein